MLTKKRITVGVFVLGLATLFAPTVLGHSPKMQSIGHVVVADGTAPPPPPIPYNQASA